MLPARYAIHKEKNLNEWTLQEKLLIARYVNGKVGNAMNAASF